MIKNAPNTIDVVKTIYDPSPVGFTVPGGNAFTGFTETGMNKATMNVDGTGVKSVFDANMGHHYWTNSNKEETIFFPAAGYMDNGMMSMPAMALILSRLCYLGSSCIFSIKKTRSNYGTSYLVLFLPVHLCGQYDICVLPRYVFIPCGI